MKCLSEDLCVESAGPHRLAWFSYKPSTVGMVTNTVFVQCCCTAATRVKYSEVLTNNNKAFVCANNQGGGNLDIDFSPNRTGAFDNCM